MKNITEQDRSAKMAQKAVSGLRTQSQGEDIISKIFNRPVHVAHDRRAKQDAVIGYINDKFLANQGGIAADKERLR